MVKKMPPIIKFFAFLLVLNVILFGLRVSAKNATADKCIKNVINDVLKNNISNYENKEKLVNIKEAFYEFKKQGLSYAYHHVAYDEGNEIYNVFVVFKNKSGDFASERNIEIAMKIKREILTYKFEDATIIYLK
ncbi:hypothetical protein [Caloramator mitchellensis]|nr:hypothetical protein [Caloramator mitchellensis]